MATRPAVKSAGSAARRQPGRRDYAQMLERMRESEEHHRLLFETSPLPMMVREDRTFRLLAVNGAAVRFYGFSRDELLRMTTLDLRPAGDRERLVADWSGRDPKITYTDYRRHQTRDGRIIEVEVTAAPFVFQGRSAKLIVVNDITERLRYQREIEDLNAELERRVSDRTAQLELSNRELESFAYSVSHDLRAPLRSIEGFSQALLEDYGGRIDETAADYLRRVHAATQRMSGLIDDLLALSRVSSTEMRRAPVDLSALAAEIVEELRRQESQRAVSVTVEPGMRVQGDPSLLRIALQNLLHNAWKFTGRNGSATIAVGAMQREGVPAFFVRDNGVGFDMAYSGKLFGAFQRLHAEAEFPGTGVGLATVRRIIRRHAGSVWADGAVGRGATFYFTLGNPL